MACPSDEEAAARKAAAISVLLFAFVSFGHNIFCSFFACPRMERKKGHPCFPVCAADFLLLSRLSGKNENSPTHEQGPGAHLKN